MRGIVFEIKSIYLLSQLSNFRKWFVASWRKFENARIKIWARSWKFASKVLNFTFGFHTRHRKTSNLQKLSKLFRTFCGALDVEKTSNFWNFSNFFRRSKSQSFKFFRVHPREISDFRNFFKLSGVELFRFFRVRWRKVWVSENYFCRNLERNCWRSLRKSLSEEKLLWRSRIFVGEVFNSRKVWSFLHADFQLCWVLNSNFFSPDHKVSREKYLWRRKSSSSTTNYFWKLWEKIIAQNFL